MSCVLGIETSCDETGVAVVKDGHTILANEVASQVALHAQFGGVVPEIASRRHVECISQLTKVALDKAACTIDAVAVTNAPGLMGALLVGVNYGKALAMAWNVPYVPVHHLEGHIFSALLGDSPPEWPFLALIVSGGHTCLVWCAKPHHYELIGSTRDDAVGECFDKVARLLDLPYPGGPSIQRAAEGGDPHAVDFPRGMVKGDSLEFSYSGLKTAVLYEVRKNGRPLADVAASFQFAAVDALLIKTQIAIRKTGAKRLVLAGGVAANRLLRTRLQEEVGIPVTMPPIALCVDNGAMIAAAGASRLRHGIVGNLRGTASPSMPLQ
ncbi:MAG: tRNA (adenosine(37)-N6)-threonylcarbamoyltransferase complex transferase subunit TsaD [Candidatus Hydrogenedentes bacterium]|nr:tRNA (adenosine(37)-N6)-threonylcarbamoyltransferase complex transferase subunit TsaD [Candidatus Hydrogenedentota bacterium]